MGKMVYRKLEATDIQGICVKCGKNPQRKNTPTRYKPICRPCEKERNPNRRRGTQTLEPKKVARRERDIWVLSGTVRVEIKKSNKRHRYKKFKKTYCEDCGFIAVNKCQLDVDHKDGNPNNNDESNLQTLCSNCHRLKTLLNKDWQKKRPQGSEPEES